MTPETPTPPASQKRFWKKAIVPIGVLTIAGLGGVLWARKFIYEDVVPIVEESLQKELNRPVKLGKVQGLSLSSLRLGKSEIPVTAKDSDHVEIEAIDVNFDLWDAIQRKKLKIKVDLVNPTAFFEEDKPGTWIATEIAAKQDDGYAGDVEVAEIKLSNATIELLPIAKEKQPRRAVKLQNMNTTIEVFDRGKNLKIASTGESAAQGNFDVKAEVWNKTGEQAKSGVQPTSMALDINGEVRSQKMLLSEVDRLVRLPVNVESGELGSNINVQLRANEKYPQLKGTATFRDIAAKAPGIAYGVSKVEGDIKFDGQTVILEKSKALVAKAVNVQANGKVDLAKETLDLKAKTGATDIAKTLKALDVKSPVAVAGELLSEVNIKGTIAKPEISGEVKSSKPIAITPPQSKGEKGLPDVRLSSVKSQFTFDPKSMKLGIKDFTAIPEFGGKINGKGTIELAKLDNIKLKIQTNGFIDIAKALKAFNFELPVAVAGEVLSEVNITGPIANLSISGQVTNNNPIAITPPKNQGEKVLPDVRISSIKSQFIFDIKSMKLGITDLAVVPELGGTINGKGTVDFAKPESSNLRINADGLDTNKIAKLYSPIPLDIRGNLSADLNVTGNIANLSHKTVQVIGSTRLSDGIVSVSSPIGITTVNSPIVANIAWNGKQLDIKEATTPGLYVNGSIATRLDEKFEITDLNLNVKAQDFAITSTPTGSSNDRPLSGTATSDLKITGTPSNIVIAGDLSLNRVNVNTNALANAFKQQSSTTTDTTNDISGLNITTARLNLAFDGIQVNDSKIDPLNGTLAYEAMQGIDLNLIGRRDRIAAKLDRNSISANLQWGESRIALQSAGNDFNIINLAMRQVDLGELNGFGLEKPLSQLLAQSGAAQEIGNPTLGGQLNGDLSVNLKSQQLQTGKVQIDRFRLGNFRAGSLVANLQNANLSSQSIANAAVTINQPELGFKFNAQSIQATVNNINLASGSIAGAVVEFNAPQGLGFNAAKIQANIGAGNLKTGQNGVVTVLKPSVGLGQAEDFKAAFFVSSTALNLQQSVLRLPLKDDNGKLTGEIGSIALKANLTFQGEPKIDAEMDIVDGQFQDVLRTAQLFTLNDLSRGTNLPKYGSAADVLTTPIGETNAPVLKQLQRFAEVNQILSQNAVTRQNTLIPTELDIRGRFSGKVKVAGSFLRPDRLTASVKMNAKTLEWRPYASYLTKNNETNRLEPNYNRVLKAENAVLEAGLENGVLTVRPFILKSGSTTVRLSSVQLGAVEQQSGQLKIENLPVEDIQNFIPYPLDLAGQPISLSGNLNGTITLSGEANKPNFVGAVDLTNGALNGQPLQSAVGSFNYSDGRVKFKNTIVANSSEPIAIVGELPYDLDLPTGKISSPDRSFQVSGRVKDDGLSLLNMLGQPITWKGGKGQLNFDVSSGAGKPLVVQGELKLDGATINAQALPEDLTNVKGLIRADFTGIHVEELRGEFSRGEVVARGSLPVFGYVKPELPAEPPASKENPPQAIPLQATPVVANTPLPLSKSPQPLLVDLRRLAINLKGLYQGAVNGRVIVGGSALSPKIGGNIVLSDGRVILSETNPPEELKPGAKFNGRPGIELENLKLRLSDNIRVVRAPILNFVARGDLNVTGTLDRLQPAGRIDLEAGQVNLFTTQFVLARGYRNFAEFRPELGLDPNLDVRLITSVPEVTRTRIPTNSITSEIAQGINVASTVGGVQTIRIQARVEGPASQLTRNLELKSSPGRSTTEIVSLLGGGFVNTLGRGDDATLGIANFAGSALLTNVQGIIGNAIGLSEFRLFPTLIGNQGSQTSTLGLAAEAGVDILRTADGLPVLSATALRVLTAPNQTTQFGLRYRVNEQIQLRGTTDFSGDSRAIVEFEGRF